MPLISLIRLPWRCAVWLERVSIKMHRNPLSVTPIMITSADGFRFFSQVLSIHCAHRQVPTLPSPVLVPLFIRSTTADTFAPEWQRRERMEETADGSKANGRGCLPCYQGWLTSKSTCVWPRARSAATQQWPAMIIHYDLNYYDHTRLY